jgi:hypothetical protein
VSIFHSHALRIYCADIGSIPKSRFAWAGQSSTWRESDSSIENLATSVAESLDAGDPVALGFECPLFVPIDTDPNLLGCARKGEGMRPWSANAGAASLATGLVQVPWLLRSIRERCQATHRVFLN